MKPSFYMNVRVATQATQGSEHQIVAGSGMTIDIMARILKSVHMISAREGLKFASAFPLARTGRLSHPGTVLRVFVETREAADLIADSLDGNNHLTGYIQVGRIRPVPQGIQSSVSYPRFRISTRNNAHPEHRLRRLEEGSSMPYLKLTSGSNGQRFSLRFDVVYSDTAPSAEIEPDGYGLSVSTRAFSLPDIKDDIPGWQTKGYQS